MQQIHDLLKPVFTDIGEGLVALNVLIKRQRKSKGAVCSLCSDVKNESRPVFT